ncbi:MAG: ABC transporter ATP-binding protein [Actinomycetota bacterium]
MAVLDVTGVSVRFGGIHALGDVSLFVNAGEIVGLIGPNGAGKTTLFNVISGLRAADAGSVYFLDEDITGLAPEHRSLLGVGRTFQSVEVFRGLAVEENVMIAREAREKAGPVATALRTPWARIEAKRSEEKVRVLLRILGLDGIRKVLAGDLPLGAQRRVELARALAGQPKLLLLDEPASGMDTKETHSLAQDLLRIRAALGVTMLMVEHDMRLVMDICDYIYVLNFGKLMADGRPSEVRSNPEVVAAYLGAEGDEPVGAACS